MATNIVGTWLENEIEGSSEAEIISGLRGDDYLNGKGNNDTLYGGIGSDTLIGSEGNDRLFGQTGDDVLFGTEGNDRLWGFWGRDTLYGGSDNDVLEGNSAADLLYGEAGEDVLLGGFGDDTLLSGFSYDNKIEEDTLIGGKGKDTFDLTAFFTFGEGAIDFVTPNIAIVKDFNPEEGDSIELYPMEKFKKTTGLSLEYEYSVDYSNGFVNTSATEDVIIEAEIEEQTYTLAVIESASNFY